MSRYAIVPAYNEESSIESVVSNLSKYVSKVIVVNDCSTDNTEIKAIQSGAHVLSNLNNLGYEYTIARGMSLAVSEGASSILTFDADGQHPYNVINLMFELIESGNSDIVVGARQSLPRISEQIFSCYTRIRFGVPDILCGMKCYSVVAINQTGFTSTWDSIGSFITLKALALQLNVASVPIHSLDRSIGISRFGTSFRSELKVFIALLRSFLI